MTRFTGSVADNAALVWPEATGWPVANRPDTSLSDDTLTLSLSRRERDSYSEVVLAQRLRDAPAPLNAALPAKALDDTFRRLTRLEAANPIQRNLDRLMVDGVAEE